MPGNCDPRFKDVPRNWAVAFLPYVGAETFIGYPNPNKGHGYGSWVEFFASENEARALFGVLAESGWVEWVELRKAGPAFRLMGRLISEWHDASENEEQ